MFRILTFMQHTHSFINERYLHIYKPPSITHTLQVVETGRHAGVDEPGDAQGPGDAGRYESTAEARAALKERANDENPRTPEEMVEATKNT
jgi:hypothetical protein